MRVVRYVYSLIGVSLKGMQDCRRRNAWSVRCIIPRVDSWLIGKLVHPDRNAGPATAGLQRQRSPENWGLAAETEWTRRNLWNVCDRLETVHGARKWRACTLRMSSYNCISQSGNPCLVSHLTSITSTIPYKQQQTLTRGSWDTPGHVHRFSKYNYFPVMENSVKYILAWFSFFFLEMSLPCLIAK